MKVLQGDTQGNHFYYQSIIKWMRKEFMVSNLFSNAVFRLSNKAILFVIHSFQEMGFLLHLHHFHSLFLTFSNLFVMEETQSNCFWIINC